MTSTLDIERNVLPARGPKFLRGPSGEVLFKFVVDPTNVIGPRPATEADQTKHPGAWAEFQREQALSVLDRDGDGADGGSLPEEVTVQAVENSHGQPLAAEPARRKTRARKG